MSIEWIVKRMGWRTFGDVARAFELPNLVHASQLRTQATMDTKDLAGNDGSDGKTVEQVNEGLPDLDVATGASAALVKEAVDAGDGGGLVVAAQKVELGRVLDFVAEQKEDGLESLWAAVDIVTKEEIVGLGWEAAHVEQAQQIVVLSRAHTHNEHDQKC